MRKLALWTTGMLLIASSAMASPGASLTYIVHGLGWLLLNSIPLHVHVWWCF